MNATSDAAVAERYEVLRTAVLARRSSEDRHGLVLMLREGMAAWMAAWAACSTRPSACTAGFAPPDDLTLAEPSAVVALLASMALATLQEHPS